MDLRDLSPSIIWVIKSRIKRWVGHVACMGKGEVYTLFWWENLSEMQHLEDLEVDGMLLRRVFKR
jgi:hypothetical protein